MGMSSQLEQWKSEGSMEDLPSKDDALEQMRSPQRTNSEIGRFQHVARAFLLISVCSSPRLEKNGQCLKRRSAGHRRSFTGRGWKITARRYGRYGKTNVYSWENCNSMGDFPIFPATKRSARGYCGLPWFFTLFFSDLDIPVSSCIQRIQLVSITVQVGWAWVTA